MHGEVILKKKVDNIYYENLSFNNLLNCYKIIKKTCKNKKAINKFELNLNTNIYNIYTSLYNKTYVPYKYTIFMIFEPKPRIVMSQCINDKIVNHFISKYYLLPYLDNKLIDANVATRVNKGTSYANKLMVKYINNLRMIDKNKDIYVLKIDISKYFYNINHNILIEFLKKDVSDENVINLIKIVLSETNSNYVNEKIEKLNEENNIDMPIYKYDVGLGLGAMTAQFFAIYFLNNLDHYIKEKLKCHYYIRYMNDLVFLSHDKLYLKNILKIISKKVTALGLKINPKSNIYNLRYGINFLEYKYKIINNKFYVLLKKGNKKRIKKKLEYFHENDLIKYYASLGSYNGYLKLEGECFKMKAIEKYESLKKDNNKSIILIKEGVFYKTFKDDAIILWHIMNYRLTNDSLSFSLNVSNKVFDELLKKEISYIIMGDDILKVSGNDEVYDLYNKIASYYYDKYKKKEKLTNLLNNLLDKDLENYDKIFNFFESININT